MGEHGWGRGERGGGGGGEATITTAPNPPPPQRSPTPPNPPPRNESFLSSRPTKATTGRSPGPKGPNPPHHHHRTAYQGRPRPQTHQPPQDRHHNPPPPPPTKTDNPKGAKKKDDRPEDPIFGTVVHVPYPKGVERGTVRGIHGRKYGAVWVEYPGGTTLYEVNRSLLFPTPRRPSGTGKRPGRRAQRRPNPPPRQSKRLTPQTQTLPPNSLTQLTPLTPLTPHPDPQRCGTPLRGPTRYEGPDRDPRGHNGHGQHT